MKQFLTFILLSLVLVSCVKNELPPENSLLQGIWEYDSQIEIDSSYATIYRKVSSLSENAALIIEGDTVFKSWDSGFCGTPPLSFHLTEGRYHLVNDVINVEMNHYFLNNANLQIISNDGKKLTLKRI